MLNVLIAEKLVDEAYVAAHTTGFAALAEIAAKYPPAVAAEICGVNAADIVKAARWFGSSAASLSLYCQGLNQSVHGTHNNAGIIHLHLATGQIGKPGAGPFSLTGQPNAMGGREVGGLANLLSAHRDLGNPAHRAEMARFWGVPFVPAKPGKAAVNLFKSLKSGEIKAVWIACTNPAQSLPNQAAVREALRAAEYVVLQEAYANTDTADYADLLLPASSWGEKYGTVTNSERCITRVQSAVAPPGEARHDWEIVVDFARRLGRQTRSCRCRQVVPLRRCRVHLQRASRKHAWARPRYHRPQLCPARCGWSAAMALSGRCGQRQGPPLRGRALSDGRWQGALRRHRACPDRRWPDPGCADQPPVRAHARSLARHEPDRHRPAPVQSRGRTGSRHAPLRHASSPARERRYCAGRQCAGRNDRARRRAGRACSAAAPGCRCTGAASS